MKGASVEHDARRLLTRVAYSLSSRRGIRVNPYLPALDIDSVDLRLHLESQTSKWSIGIEIAVRSSSQPVLQLGSANKYGTLNYWLSRARKRNIPCLVFFFHWQTDRLIVFTPQMIKELSTGKKKQSIRIGDLEQDNESFLFELLSSIACLKDEATARTALT